MDSREFAYLRKSTNTMALENVRAVLGIVLGLFLVLWIRNPVQDDNISEESRKTQSLLAALIAFYFIFDFYLTRSMALTLNETEDVLKYPTHFRVGIAIQFILLAAVILLGGSLVWNSESLSTQEPMIKKMIVVFLCLYVYKLISVFFVYHIIVSSYESFRIKLECSIEDKDAFYKTRPKPEEV